MTKIKNNKLLSLIIAFVVLFSFFSVFGNATVNAASSLGSVIDGGKVISAGNYLLSPNGNCKAVMQGDGNFVIYKGGKAIWCSATITSAYSSYFAVIQTDGNFVIYGQNGSSNTPIWATDTNYGAVSGYKYQLRLNDSGRLDVINTKNSNQLIWNNTSQISYHNNLNVGEKMLSPNGKYTAEFQTDGNFVLFDISTSTKIPLWNSRTFVSDSPLRATKGSIVKMQEDGNLVIYDSANKAIWYSKTAVGAQSGFVYKLMLTNSGKLQIVKCNLSKAGLLNTLWTSDKLYDWPVPGYTNITSPFGSRNGTMHNGIDISSSGISGKPIIAAKAGKVIEVCTSCTHNYGKNYSCGCGGGYGNYVVIEHYDGTKTRYAHCSTINVSLNQRVYNGKKIATVGSTGHSTGAHLHFEVYSNSTTRIDPLSVSYTVNSK